MPGRESSVGRAKMALVLGPGEAAKAVVATVTVRVRRRTGGRRLAFTGPVTFEPETIEHLIQIVLAAADRTIELVDPSRKELGFEVSVVNLGAASASDLGVAVSGFSADVAIFLAILSAALEIPLPCEAAFTGHLASPDGDIRAVRSVPAKLDAAAADGTVKHFVCPALDADTSLTALAPKQREQAIVAIARAREHLRVTQVADVHQLLRAVLADEGIVLAALRRGFFGGLRDGQVLDVASTPVQEAAAFLASENEVRFWRSLEARLLAGGTVGARRLLATRVQFHVQRKEYPQGIGFRLLQLVRSLPRTTRRLKLRFPLLAVGKCLELCPFAREADQDVQHLVEAVLLGNTQGYKAVAEPVVLPNAATATASARTIVETALDRISAEALVEEVDLPIDSARGAYVLESPISESSEAFVDTVAAFYLFLLCRTESVPGSVDSRAVAKDAIALLERAFANGGGFEAALAEARYPAHGGLRRVLDVVTDQYKAEQRAKHVSRVIREAIDPLDWAGRVAFTAALIERLGHQLPVEIREQPPERFAPRVEQFLETYARSLDRVKDLLRSL